MRGLPHPTCAIALISLCAASACNAPPAVPRAPTGTPIELFARLSNIGALARICDDRAPDVVTRDWVRRFQPRLATVEARLASLYGEAEIGAAAR